MSGLPAQDRTYLYAMYLSRSGVENTAWIRIVSKSFSTIRRRSPPTCQNSKKTPVQLYWRTQKIVYVRRSESKPRRVRQAIQHFRLQPRREKLVLKSHHHGASTRKRPPHVCMHAFFKKGGFRCREHARPHQQMLAAEHARLAKASATPLPRMLPRAERLVTALENSRMMNATVDRIVCAHQDNQLTCNGVRVCAHAARRRSRY